MTKPFVSDALIRAARYRVLALEEELAREWHPQDPLRHRLERELAAERARLAERLADNFKPA